MDWPVTLLAAFLAPVCPRFAVFCSTGFLFAVSMLEKLGFPDIAAFGFLGGYAFVAFSLVVSYFWNKSTSEGSEGTKLIILVVAGNQLACLLLLSLDWVRHRLRADMFQFINNMNKVILCGTVPIAALAMTGSTVIEGSVFSRWLLAATASTVASTVLYDNETRDMFDKWCNVKSRGALLLLLFVFAWMRWGSPSRVALEGSVLGAIAAFGTCEQIISRITRLSPAGVWKTRLAVGVVLVAAAGVTAATYAAFSASWSDLSSQQLIDVISNSIVLLLALVVLAVQVFDSVLQLTMAIVVLLISISVIVLILLHNVVLPSSLITMSLSVVTEGLSQKWTLSSLIVAGTVGVLSFFVAGILSLPAAMSEITKHATAAQSEAALLQVRKSATWSLMDIHSTALMFVSVISCACCSVFDLELMGSTIALKDSSGTLTSFRVVYAPTLWSTCWFISVVFRLALGANSVRLYKFVDFWRYTVPAILSIAFSFATGSNTLATPMSILNQLVSHIVSHVIVVIFACFCTYGVVSVWKDRSTLITSVFRTSVTALQRTSAPIIVIVVFVLLECITWALCGLRPSFSVSITSVVWHVIMLAYTVVLVTGLGPTINVIATKLSLAARLVIGVSVVVLLLLNLSTVGRSQRHTNESIIWRANTVLSIISTLVSSFSMQSQMVLVDSTFAFVCWLGNVLRSSQHLVHDLSVMMVVMCVILPALQWLRTRSIDRSSFVQAYKLLWFGLYAAVACQAMSTHTFDAADHFVSFWRSPRLLYPIKNIVIVCIPGYLLYNCGVYLSSEFAARSAGIDKLWPLVGIVAAAALAADSHITQLLCFCVVIVCSSIISYATRRKTEDLKAL